MCVQVMVSTCDLRSKYVKREGQVRYLYAIRAIQIVRSFYGFLDWRKPWWWVHAYGKCTSFQNCCMHLRVSRFSLKFTLTNYLNVNWKVLKDSWMAHLCHSVTCQLPCSHSSVTWMAEAHPVHVYYTNYK